MAAGLASGKKLCRILRQQDCLTAYPRHGNIQARLRHTDAVIPTAGGGRWLSCPNLAHSILLLPWRTGEYGFFLYHGLSRCRCCHTLALCTLDCRSYLWSYLIDGQVTEKWKYPFCSSVPDPQAVIASMYNSLPAFTAHDRFYDLDMDMNGIFYHCFSRFTAE